VKEIDVERMRATLQKGLPVRARWLLHGEPLAFDFSCATRPLRHLAESELVVGSVRPEWAALLVFGESDFADRGGAQPLLCVAEDTGRVYGLDVERDGAPLYLFNSDVDRFVATFALFDGALRRGAPTLDALDAQAEAIDPDAYRESDWPSLVEHLKLSDTT
jgi:hypothetical protein